MDSITNLKSSSREGRSPGPAGDTDVAVAPGLRLRGADGRLTAARYATWCTPAERRCSPSSGLGATGRPQRRRCFCPPRAPSARPSTWSPGALRSTRPRACWNCMEFDIITAFPAMFEGPLSQSIVRRARDGGLVEVRLHDLRD